MRKDRPHVFGREIYIEGQKHPMLDDLRMGHAGPKTFTLPLQLKWLATRRACSLKIRTILNFFLFYLNFTIGLLHILVLVKFLPFF